MRPCETLVIVNVGGQMPFTISIYLLLDSLLFSTVYYEETHEVLLFLVLILINRGGQVNGTFSVLLL